MKKKSVLGLGLCVLLLSCQNRKVHNQTVKQNNPPEKPKNVILLIGDGMGLSQVSSVYYFEDREQPHFSRFKVIGLHNCSSAKQKITDSAAGATAFASGVRSYNGAIGKDVDRNDVANVSDLLKDKDIAFGLVANSSITHATPAAFYAHAKSRKEQEHIASQLVHSSVDFFAAGGLNYFTNRGDGQNLYGALESSGFIMDSTSIDHDNTLETDKKYGYLLAKDGMPSMLDGRGDFLEKATTKAIDYLQKQDAGFFLMVEGSQIDWEGHAKNKDGVIAEMNDFNKVIGKVLDFAEKDGQTLVIVTADHETGGFSLSPKWSGQYWDYNAIDPTFYNDGRGNEGSAGHTASLIPVFAFGPGANNFGGIYDNTAIHHKIKVLMGL